MMSILNKLNDIIIDSETQKEIEHLDRGLNQQDYDYMISVQKTYDIAFDLWKDYLDKVQLAMIEIDGKEKAEDIFLSNCNQKYDKYSQLSTFFDYSNIHGEWISMNIFFISSCVSHFNAKYNFLKDCKLITQYDIFKKQFDRNAIQKIDYKYILGFMQKQYGFIPPQKEQ